MSTNYAPEPHLSKAPEHAWFVTYQDADGDEQITYTDGLAGPLETTTLDAGVSLPLVFRAAHRAGSDPPTDTYHRERYRAFKDLAKFAGQYTTFPTRTNARTERTSAGEIYTSEGLLFTEDTPPTSGSLLLKVVPGYETSTTDGIWVLLDSLEDETMLENAACQLTISATVIAWVSDYDERASLTRDLEYGGL